MADASDSKSDARKGREGSSPSSGTSTCRAIPVCTAASAPPQPGPHGPVLATPTGRDGDGVLRETSEDSTVGRMSTIVGPLAVVAAFALHGCTTSVSVTTDRDAAVYASIYGHPVKQVGKIAAGETKQFSVQGAGTPCVAVLSHSYELYWTTVERGGHVEVLAGLWRHAGPLARRALANKVDVGMPEDFVYLAWGSPRDTNTTVFGSTRSRTLWYGELPNLAAVFVRDGVVEGLSGR